MRLPLSPWQFANTILRQQDLQDALPDAFFAPALIAAGNRGPGSETLGQFAPGRTGAHDPEQALDYQAVIDRWTPRLRLLRRQERLKLLPVGIGERRQSLHLQGSWWLERDRRGLACATQPMEVLRSRLMSASKA